MRPAFSDRLARGITALACGALMAACAPDRVPGSTVSQGDAGIAFHRELAALRGAGASSGGRGGTSTSGASYGGGSSSSTRAPAGFALQAPDLRPGGRACDWIATAEPASTHEAAKPFPEPVLGNGADAWVAANCASTGEPR